MLFLIAYPYNLLCFLQTAEVFIPSTYDWYPKSIKKVVKVTAKGKVKGKIIQDVVVAPDQVGYLSLHFECKACSLD